jgi:hypothetical protein
MWFRRWRVWKHFAGTRDQVKVGRLITEWDRRVVVCLLFVVCRSGYYPVR